MTMRQTFGNWTQVTGWGTSITTLANATGSTSGTIDNSSQRSFSMDVTLMWDKAASTGTGNIELWILPEGNDGAAQLASVPPQGARLVMVVPTIADQNEYMQVERMDRLPEKFAFYLLNNSGNAFANADVRYRFVDLVDV